MLVKYLIKRWPLVAVYLVVTVLAPIVNANAALISGEMMDLAGAGDVSGFFRSLGIFAIYFLVHGGLLFIIQSIRIKIISCCRRDLKQDMFRQIMSADNAFFSKPDSGFHIAAFSNDITILESKYFEAWLEAIEAVLSLVTALSALLLLNKVMAVIIVVGEVFSLVLCFLVRRHSMFRNKVYIEKLANFTQRIKDYFTSFQMIRNYSVENQIKQHFSRMNRDVEDSKDAADMSLSFVNTLTMVCNSMLKFMLCAIGVILMIKGDITIGIVYSSYRFTDQVVGPMHSLITKINSIESVKSIVSRIKHISNASRNEQKQENVILDVPATIELDNVGVNIDGKHVLDGTTYTFEPGKKYLIIGRNGAGKSTLLRLLKRSQEDFEGAIRINGKDIRSFSYSSLANIVSYINESVSLICDTVRQNITLYRDIPEDQLQDVVKQVGLKVNLDRVVRDGERNLSSGETRRVEIARSLINRASVIIYDEAISTLDIQTAYSIEKTLLSLKEQTVLFVSHNFSSQLIDQYDQIILLDEGKICGSGTHAQLMETNQYYRNIMSIKNG